MRKKSTTPASCAARTGVSPYFLIRRKGTVSGMPGRIASVTLDGCCLVDFFFVAATRPSSRPPSSRSLSWASHKQIRREGITHEQCRSTRRETRQDPGREGLGRPPGRQGRGRRARPHLHRPAPRARGHQPAGVRRAADGGPPGAPPRSDDRDRRPQHPDARDRQADRRPRPAAPRSRRCARTAPSSASGCTRSATSSRASCTSSARSSA